MSDRPLAGSAALAILLVLAGSAWCEAQTPSQPGPDSPLDEVTVTARRIAESARKIPVAVTVLNSDDVGRLAINTPLDLNKIAGLGGAPIGALTSVNFTLRGQGSAFAGQPGVIPYFAEVPNFPLTYFDLQNVQVVKGPQGTLFGQTSTGGVVLFEPKRPSDEFEGYLDVQAGNHGYQQIEGAINVPLVSDKLLARAAVRFRDRDGWATAIYSNGDGGTADLNNLDNTSFRASVLWRPIDTLENYTIYSQDTYRNNGTSSPIYYVDARYMNPAVRNLVPASVPSIAAAWEFWTGYAPPPGQTFSQLLTAAYEQQLLDGPLVMRTDYDQRNTTINRGWINQTTWNIRDDLTIRTIFGLRWQTVQGAIYDQDASNLPLLDFQCRFVPGTTRSTGTCAKMGGWPDRTLTDELQVHGESFDDRLQWQLGAFYLRTGIRDFRESTRPFVVFGSLTGDPATAAFCTSVGVATPCAAMARTDTHSTAVFGQATLALADDVRLTAGYRETWDYSRTDTTAKPSYRIPFNGQNVAIPVYGEAPAAGATILSTVVDLPENESYNLSVDWSVNDAVLLYLAHRSGYKTGGINAVADPGSPHRTYGPERVKDIELGLKSEWSIGTVRGWLNADAYHTWYDDIQEGEIIPGTAQTITTNLANAKIDGLELEGTIYLTEWLQIAGSLSLTDAEYSDWLEHSTCTAQYWRPQCTGLPGATEISIDHARGILEVADQTVRFEPDRFANASKQQWSIQPSLLLERWLGEDVTVSANIYHRGPYVDATAVANTSKVAGVPQLARATVFGYSTSDPYDAPGYTNADLRIDWRQAFGSQVNVAAGVTNFRNRIYRVSSASAFEIIGDVYTIIGEPRMWFAQVRYEF